MTSHEILNKSIANFAVLYFKLHHFHWFVSGPGFYHYHKLFEELYDETTENLDQFAERLLAIGGTPASTLKEYLNLSTISEGGNEKLPVEIVKVLSEDYGKIRDDLKAGIGVCESEGDYPTADMFIGTIEAMEKHLWMMRQAAS